MNDYNKWLEKFDELKGYAIPLSGEDYIEFEELSDWLISEVNELRNGVSQLRSELDDLENELDRSDDEVSQLNRELHDAYSDNEVLEENIHLRKYRLDKLDEKLKFDEFLEMFGMFEGISYHKFIKIINEIKQTYSSNKINKLYDANDNSSTGM